MTETIRRRFRNLAGLNLLVVSALLVLCTTSNAQNQCQTGQTTPCVRPSVILVRGGLGYWPGAQAMADQFSSLGYCPSIIKDWEYCIFAKRIACAIQDGRMNEVVIVGYSSGADTACLLARRLDRFGVRVQTMVLIDATLGLSVPANVGFCVNFYASRALDAIPMFRGVPVAADSPGTQLYNVDVRDFPEFADHFKRNHFVLGSTAILREMTIQVVESQQTADVSTPAGAIVGDAPVQPMGR